MAETAQGPALRRKIVAPTGPLDRHGTTPAKALGLAFARAMEDAAGLEAAISGFAQDQLTQKQVCASITPTDLVFVSVSKSGAVGLAIWDCVSVSALTEQLITGRVLGAKSEPRPPSATDAAIVAGVHDRFMTMFDARIQQVETPPPVAGFRTREVLAGPRAASLLLEEMPYRQFDLTLDMNAGAKIGGLRLIYPWSDADRSQKKLSEQAKWRQDWHETIEGVHVPIEAILHRLALSLDVVSSLEVGTMLPIPAAAIGAVRIEGATHAAVAGGRLGQHKGHRAVRLTGMVDLPGVEADTIGALPPVEPNIAEDSIVPQAGDGGFGPEVREPHTVLTGDAAVETA